MLSEKLKKLENDRIVKRTSYDEVLLRVEYKLTTNELELDTILLQLRDWTAQYVKE